MQSHANVRVIMTNLINEVMKSFKPDRAIAGTLTDRSGDYHEKALRRIQELQRELLLATGTSIEELHDASSHVREAYEKAIKLVRFDVERCLYRYAPIVDRLPYYPPDDWTVNHLIDRRPRDLAFELKLHAMEGTHHG